ncbi:MAG: hypothetical protein PHH47_11565 [Gallionella sp.]|nr:hypothetical protein [Gallionella sp.]MDD4947391.1 hypothetical protein [Gallionella sp.]
MDINTQILTQQLMWEIKEASSQSLSELSSALSRHVDIPDKVLSHYLNGNKSCGLSRLYVLARAADEMGWTGPTIALVNHLCKVLPPQDASESRAEMRKVRKQMARDQTTAIANLQKAVSNLVEEGWSDTEIVTLTKLLTEKLIPPHKREEGGLVQLAGLHELVGLDASGVAPIAWSAWQVRGIDVDAPEPDGWTPE